jgi:hypothetical protein
MDRSELVVLLREATYHPYQLGFCLPGGAIPPVPENCVSLEAGPVVFVVESRTLDDAAVGTDRGSATSDGGTDEFFDDHGPTLHVLGAADQAEHLRFDCFAREPHYHYFRVGDGTQVLCRVDQHAQGDPVRWAVRCVRDRLPEMLVYCGQEGLAEAVRSHWTTIEGVVGEVEPLLLMARDQAQDAYALRG